MPLPRTVPKLTPEQQQVQQRMQTAYLAAQTTRECRETQANIDGWIRTAIDIPLTILQLRDQIAVMTRRNKPHLAALYQAAADKLEAAK